MKKMLILTASFGDGHNAAARNLRDAIEMIEPEAKVEVLDLFETSYGKWNTLARKAYSGVVRYAPALWGGIYSWLGTRNGPGSKPGSLIRLRHALGDILHETQPDCVVSTYPAYAGVIADLYRDHAVRPFRLITVITDSISINATWYRAESDFFCVPNDASAEVLRRAGIDDAQIKPIGFPVSPLFAAGEVPPLRPPVDGTPRKVLYVINTGRPKARKAIDRLLEIPDVHLTVTVGRDARLKASLLERVERHPGRLQVLGWTNQMPHLMLTHHLLVGKAGGATVQEAIAARCPMIVNQVIPGQEEGNAQLIEQLDVGTVAEKNRAMASAVERAFRRDARTWHRWRENLERISRPDASLRLAEFILGECDWSEPGKPSRVAAADPMPLSSGSPAPAAVSRNGSLPGMLLCDFHTHSNYSDGKLTVPELIDFYGQRGFDCLCITDHLADPRRIIGKLARLTNLTLSAAQLEEYFEVIAREARRAWRKYGLLVMAGIEFNKDGLTKKSSAHLLGIDLHQPIDPALDLVETIAHIHAQGGLAIASHPHIMKSEWGKNTLHLWENVDRFAPLLDAWEIANRNNLFTPVGLKQLPFVANSDFHKPRHIHSWKTLLRCEKDPEAIKECIRRNEHVAITFYREDRRGHVKAVESAASRPDLIRLPVMPDFGFPQGAPIASVVHRAS